MLVYATLLVVWHTLATSMLASPQHLATSVTNIPEPIPGTSLQHLKAPVTGVSPLPLSINLAPNKLSPYVSCEVWGEGEG